MKIVNNYTPNKLLDLVSDTIANVSPNLGPLTAEIPLTGTEAILDSVGFVTLLVSIEQKLSGAVDLAASFMAQGDPDAPENPFRTVGSLADHLQTLLSARQ
jgi:acyl carrier protein